MKSPVNFHGERDTRAKILRNAPQGARECAIAALGVVGCRAEWAKLRRLRDAPAGVKSSRRPCDNRISLEGQ
jgi:hypothetical protein